MAADYATLGNPRRQIGREFPETRFNPLALAVGGGLFAALASQESRIAGTEARSDSGQGLRFCLDQLQRRAEDPEDQFDCHLATLESQLDEGRHALASQSGV